MKLAASLKLTTLLMIAPCLVRSAPAWSCSLPLEPRRAAFVATVRIGEHGTLRFLLDTGTTVTVISPALAARLKVSAGRTIEALSTTGPVTVSEATLPELRAGQITAKNLAVLIAPVPQWAAYGRIDGVLGMNFLAGRSYLLDVRRSCLETDLTAEQVSGGSRLKARQVVGRVAVESFHDSSPIWLVLDSAASLTVLTSARAGAIAQRGGVTEVGSAAGRQLVKSGVVPRLTLGDIVLRDLPALLMPDSDSAADALLPVNVFTSIYVNAARTLVVLNGTRVN